MSRNLDWTPRVGQRVVCVDARKIFDYCPPRNLYRVTVFDLDGIMQGETYVIRAVLEYYGIACVRLEGIVRPTGSLGVETPYAAARFRPLDETSDPIAIFREILRTADQRIEEKA